MKNIRPIFLFSCALPSLSTQLPHSQSIFSPRACLSGIFPVSTCHGLSSLLFFADVQVSGNLFCLILCWFTSQCLQLSSDVFSARTLKFSLSAFCMIIWMKVHLILKQPVPIKSSEGFLPRQSGRCWSGEFRCPFRSDKNRFFSRICPQTSSTARDEVFCISSWDGSWCTW